jgi:hypothetical protein
MVTICSIRSSSVGSAQWMSSTWATSVRLVRGGGQPDDGGDPLDGLGLIGQETGDLGVRLLGCVLITDACRGAHDLAKRPEGDALAVGQATSVHHARVNGNPGEQLADEAALADARVAEDGHEPRATVGAHRLVRLEQRRKLPLAADHRGVEMACKSLAGPDTD